MSTVCADTKLVHLPTTTIAHKTKKDEKRSRFMRSRINDLFFLNLALARCDDDEVQKDPYLIMRDGCVVTPWVSQMLTTSLSRFLARLASIFSSQLLFVAVLFSFPS